MILVRLPVVDVDTGWRGLDQRLPQPPRVIVRGQEIGEGREVGDDLL
jgi:hypothetical protein